MKLKRQTNRYPKFGYANSISTRIVCAPDTLITNCSEKEYECIIDKFKIKIEPVDCLSDSENITEQMNNEYNFDQHKRRKNVNLYRRSSLQNKSNITPIRQSKNEKRKKKDLQIKFCSVDKCNFESSLKTNSREFDYAKYVLCAPDTLITNYSEKQFEHIIDKFKVKIEDSKGLCYSKNIIEQINNKYNFDPKHEVSICSVNKCNLESILPLLEDERKIIKNVFSIFGLHHIILNVSLIQNYKDVKCSLCKDHRQMVDLITSCQLCGNKLYDDFNSEVWKMYEEWNLLLSINNICLILKPGMFVCATCQYYLIEADFGSSGTLEYIQKNVIKNNFKLIEIFGPSPKPVSEIHQSTSNIIPPNGIAKALIKPMNSKKVKFADPLVTSTIIVERYIKVDHNMYEEFEEVSSMIEKLCSSKIRKHEKEKNESVLYSRVIEMKKSSKYEYADLIHEPEKFDFYHVVNINSQGENKNEYNLEGVHIKPKIDPVYHNSFEHINKNYVGLKKTLYHSMYNNKSNLNMKKQRHEYDKSVILNGPRSENCFYKNGPIKNNTFKHFKNETISDSNYIDLVSDKSDEIDIVNVSSDENEEIDTVYVSSDENEEIDTVYVSSDENEEIDTVYVSSDENEEISYDKVVHMKPKIDPECQTCYSFENFIENSVKLNKTLPNGINNSIVGVKNQKLESNKTLTSIRPRIILL